MRTRAEMYRVVVGIDGLILFVTRFGRRWGIFTIATTRGAMGRTVTLGFRRNLLHAE